METSSNKHQETKNKEDKSQLSQQLETNNDMEDQHEEDKIEKEATHQNKQEKEGRHLKEQKKRQAQKNKKKKAKEKIEYAQKCDEQLRETLWDDLRLIANNSNFPWMVVGDFNCILAPEEKRGEEPDFLDIVKDVCAIEAIGTPMWMFHLKLKNACKKLSEWSRNTLGNIFETTKKMEARITQLEEMCIRDNSEKNRMTYNNANALLIQHVKKEEAFWRQKAGLKWITDGDANTKFFHSVINTKRRKIHMNKIKKENDTWIEGEDNIASEAVKFFEDQFTFQDVDDGPAVLNCLPRVINDEDNNMLKDRPTLEELKNVVFTLSTDTAPGPDGTSRKFYQHCGDIIALDLFSMVTSFFAELVHNIKKPNVNCNVIMKLDMTKAFDRMSWKFLGNVMRKFGFSEEWIGMIWKFLSNNWYSININGNRHGFFHSGRGIKQGDPLSPSLFIIGAELLTRLMGQLKLESFIHYFVGKKCPVITHLSYADDTILFSSGDSLSLMAMMNKLQIYEKCSGQLVSKSKSYFLVTPKTNYYTIQDINGITGLSHFNFPFNYLGSPIYTGRKKVVYFGGLISKVVLLIQSGMWNLQNHHFLIEKYIANFFRGNNAGKNKYHRKAWKDLCFPKEGGVGFRSIQDMCLTASAKVWWNFRTRPSLLREFMEAKYCPRAHPVSKKWAPGQSHIWKRMVEIRRYCEHNINRKVGKGNLSFWWTTGSESGPLAQLIHQGYKSKKIKVSDYIIDGEWNTDNLLNLVPNSMIMDIKNIKIYKDGIDFPIWTPDHNRIFTCKFAWKSLRLTRANTMTAANCWHPKLPFKIENTNHLFRDSELANGIWNFFGASCGIISIARDIRVTAMNWWLQKSNSKMDAAKKGNPAAREEEEYLEMRMDIS
ncbi:uncharacterized protein LOC132039345 [Lycium ferocissimum]|uniref:uncharacterized protein LOC132039345 n=1 Tax=Lycium ferocissimum TaxID=112874 RepID=UPI00281640A2|nr:uncharacterized protein LOC132039345 [Lycium ferocissimum]